jgi:hypothetical protein
VTADPGSTDLRHSVGSAAAPAPFIVGAGRSGTTLLRMILDAHPELAIPPETHFIPALKDTWERAPQPRDAVIRALLHHQRWADFGIRADEFRARIDATSASTLGDVLRDFYSAYAEHHGKPRWGDKTPAYVLAMPAIAELLAEARFIHVIRDGRDVALSVRPLWFGPDTIETAAVWWKERVDAGQRAGATLAYVEVRYETLVGNVRRELKRLCRFLELDFRDEMLTGHPRAGDRLSEERGLASQGVSAELRAQIHQRVSLPPDSVRVGRWRTEMTSSERRRFEALAGDTLERLGYPLR